MTTRDFNKWKQSIEAEIVQMRSESEKLRLDTDRRFKATAKLLQQGAKMLLRIEAVQEHLIGNMIAPKNG
jgi:hypothetical protein